MPDFATTDRTKVLEWLLEQIRAVLKCETAEPQDHFVDLGGDSLTAPVLANRIYAEFGFRPALEDIFTRPLGDLSDVVAAADGLRTTERIR